VGTAVAPVGTASGAGSARITNNLAVLCSWQLALDFGAGQEFTQGWTAAWSKSSTTVTAAGESSNGSPGTGASVGAGFVASRSGSNPVPASFRAARRQPLRRRARVRPGQRHRGRTGRRRLREGDRRPAYAVRTAGARNVNLAEGLAYANGRGTWLTYHPTDPTGHLAAAWHSRTFTSRSSEARWNATRTPVAAQVPLAAAEIGEHTCNRATGPSLISGYDGTPTAFGTGRRDHPRALGQRTSFPSQ